MTAAAAPAETSATVLGISIEGFRTVRDATLRLGPVTALVGEASAGKSNLLAAISLAVDAGGTGAAEADFAIGAERIVLQAATSAGPVGLRHERTGTPSRQGSWPVAVLPSSLRDGPVIAPAQSAATDPGVAALAGALRSQATHAVSPAAHTHGLVAGLEQCCDAGVSGVLLLIEEPELFLRSQAQRYLYRLLHRFADGGNQVVYSTHAPAFLNVAQLEELAVVTREPEHGTSVHQAAALPASDGFGAMSEFDAERGELFLADVAVLVEGRTERLALPHVFRALSIDVDREGISIVECGGKANLVIFARLCQATGVPFLVLHPCVDVAVGFRYFFARKLMFVRYASAFVVLPGGFGTLDELFEALTLVQTGRVHEFPIVLVGAEHRRGLNDWLRDALEANAFTSPTDTDLLVVSDDPEEIAELVGRCHLRRRNMAHTHRAP